MMIMNPAFPQDDMYDLFRPIPLERTHTNRDRRNEEKSQEAYDGAQEHSISFTAAVRHFDASTTQLPQLPRSLSSDHRFSSVLSNIPQDEEAHRDAALQEILETSEDLFFSGDDKGRNLDEVLTKVVQEYSSSRTPLKRTKTSLPSPNYFEEEELEDLPITCDGDQLPVAAALIKYVDLVAGDIGGNRKRRCAPKDDLFGEGQPQEKQDMASMAHDLDSLDQKIAAVDMSRSSSPLSSTEDQWSERFRELSEYKQQKGHCSVPHNYTENQPLARWVKRQRHQYKPFKDRCDNSSHQWPLLVQERIQALYSIGFVWDCQGAAWDEKFAELKDYQVQHLDCNVPTNFPPNPALAMWVKCQRRQYKMYSQGLKSGMTPERARLLENIGFAWEMRKQHKRARTSS